MGILERTRLERIAFADAYETALVENDLADCIAVGWKGCACGWLLVDSSVFSA